jgi:hypothetical protein
VSKSSDASQSELQLVVGNCKKIGVLESDSVCDEYDVRVDRWTIFGNQFHMRGEW